MSEKMIVDINERNALVKQCVTCEDWKELQHFPKDHYKYLGIGSQCKSCKIKKSSERKDYRTSRLRTIGMTNEEYEKLYFEQKGICLICNEQKEILVADHCHQTIQFRGLICRSCNSGLGFFRDNIQFLEKAIEYLRKSIT